MVPEPIKEHLVQDHRVHRHQPGRIGEVEACQLFLDEVEALYGAAVIVLVVTHDEALGHAFYACRIAGQRLYGVWHSLHVLDDDALAEIA